MQDDRSFNMELVLWILVLVHRGPRQVERRLISRDRSHRCGFGGRTLDAAPWDLHTKTAGSPMPLPEAYAASNLSATGLSE